MIVQMTIKTEIYCFWFSTRPEILLHVLNYESQRIILQLRIWDNDLNRVSQTV